MAINASDKNALGPALGWSVLAVGLAAALGWVVLAQRLGDTIVMADAGAAMVIYFALLFIPLIGIAFLLATVEHRPIALLGPGPLRGAALGGLMGLGGLLVTVGFAWINGQITAGTGSFAGVGMIALALALTLVQVFAEEALFRGWLQPGLIGRLGLWPGVLLGAAMFACFHATGGARAPLSLLNLMLGGVFFGLLAQRSGGLAAPVAAHYLWNATEDCALGLVPNPGNSVLGSLFDYDLTGLPIWGGQEEGLNASIGTTLVLVALILPLIRAAQPAPRAIRA